MTNHPNRSQKTLPRRICYICPRGFSNEETYYSVLPEHEPIAQSMIDQYDDDTSSHAGWLTSTSQWTMKFEDSDYCRNVLAL